MHRTVEMKPFIEPLENRRLLARVAVIGDFTSGDDLNDVARLIKSWNPAAIGTVGDNYYDADPSIDSTIGQSFHDYLSPYVGAYGAGSTTGNRFWPALGNHDYDRGLTNYTNFFVLPNNERYYAAPPVDDIQFFVVDSDEREPDGTSSTSKQATWLKGALAASTATWKLVLFHHPAYSSGQQGSTLGMRWPFQQWGASAVINGHDHQYERLIENNFPYFVNGLGGAEIRPIDDIEPGSQVRYNGDFGAMQINSTSSTLNFKFYSRDAVVRDDYTLTKSTTPTTNLIPAGATWKYLDTGANAGTTWRASAFSDTAWKSGAGQLGYGDGDESTVVSYGPSASNKFVTTYFRRHFNIADPSQVAALNGAVLRDDGAAVYVNGTEVYRTNLPTGTIGSTTLASTVVEDNVYYAFSIPPSVLVAGDNVIAVEVHQGAIDSSDVSFDLTLDAALTGTAPTPTTPAAPTGLTATTSGTSSIALTWADRAANENGFAIERSADGGVTFGSLTTVAANVTQFTDNNLPASTRYVYRVRAYNAAGNSAYSNVAEATTPAAPPVNNSLPAPWTSGDIGAAVNAGSSAYASGTFTVKGGGGDIWNSADAFRFVYQPITGDTTIIARVPSMTNTHGWAKAGVMIRESLAAGALNAAVHVTPGNGTVMTYRDATNGPSDGWFSTGNAAIWLKLVRAGNTFTSYRSSNGTTWTQIGTESITMAANVYVGLCVAAKNTATLNTATFSNVTITGVTQAAAVARLPVVAMTTVTKPKEQPVLALLTELA